MTERYYCDECGDFGYTFVDGSVIEIIATCKCPKFLLLGESK